MDRAQRHTRGGDADGAREPPKSKTEDKEEKLSRTNSTTASPPPIRRPSPSRTARSRPRRSRAAGLMFAFDAPIS